MMDKASMSHMLSLHETLNKLLEEVEALKKHKKHELVTLRSDAAFTIISGIAYGIFLSASSPPLFVGICGAVFGVGTYCTYKGARTYARTKKLQSELERKIEKIRSEPAYKQAEEFYEEIYSN